MFTHPQGFGRGQTTALLQSYVGRPHAKLLGVNMTVANVDNLFVWVATPPTLGIIRRIIARRVSGAFGVACLGGIYTAEAKGGTALVAATQSFVGLSGAGKIVDLTIIAGMLTDIRDLSALYLNLTTGNTGALVADFFLWADAIAP